MSAGSLELVDVAIPLPVNDPFSYHVPVERMAIPPRGARVLVPFKNREILGYVVGKPEADGMAPKTKPISELLDTSLLVDEELIELSKRISEYYFCSWGEAIASALPQLAKKGPSRRRVAKEGEESSDNDGRNSHENFTLSNDQKRSCAVLKDALAKSSPAMFLLHGVTASGKTEVYAQAVQACLELGKSAICLVPEIPLTVQVRDYFLKRFRDDIVVMHSRMTPRERYESWLKIRAGQYRVVLGPRSAVFAPVRNLGLIVIDEEQEDTYKQEESPRYRTKQVACWRMEASGAVLLLGSATPSVETMFDAKVGSVKCLTLNERVTKHSLPQIEVVDIRGERNPLLSRVLDHAIEKALARKESVLLFLNRRGFSTHLRCTSCQDIVLCRFCHVSLTYHQELGAAVCHYCNFRWSRLAECPRCGNRSLQYLGMGSEKVESEIARRYPAARVARLDSDVARKRGRAEDILAAFRKNQIDILVGTQMIAKGHDFPQVTLVGVLLADLALALPDFRSSERNFQILVQVAGRAGRGTQQGRVIIQTYSPDHYSISAAARHDYDAFYRAEIESRKKAGYPPFSRLVNVIVRGSNTQRVEAHIQQLKTEALKEARDRFAIVGPAPCPIPKLRGHFRWHFLLKGESSDVMRVSLRNALESVRRPSQVFLAVDVDPANIL